MKARCLIAITTAAGAIGAVILMATTPFAAPDTAGSAARHHQTRGGIVIAVARGRQQGQTHRERPDWTRPFYDGEAVSDPAAGAERLRFTAAVPSQLGRPVATVVHRSMRPQALGLVYQSPIHGRFLAVQEPTTMSAEDLASIVANCRPETGCEGTWTLMTLETRRHALLATGQGVNSIMFIHSGIAFEIAGPDTAFSPADAVAVANAFEQAAS